MNSKDLFILIVIVVMLFAALFGSHVQAQQKEQKVLIEKRVELSSEIDSPDSTAVVLKTIKSNKSGINEDEFDIDSLIQVLCPETNSKGEQMVKIVTIHNGDTVIKESHSDFFDPSPFQEFNPENLEQEMFKSLQQFGFQGDSLFRWSTRFDSLLDPLNLKSFDLDWTGDMDEMDSLMEQHFKFNEDGNGDQMIFLSDNGDEIRIDRNGQMLFTNKNDDLDSVQSEIMVTKNDAGKKVIIQQTRIQLDELSDKEKADLKSKGIKTSTKEPDFDYLKFYPNPSEGSVNIEFRSPKPVDTEVRITNMAGKILFEEKLIDFSGEYNKFINLSENGAGTYLLQIIQGKKVITRKIIVD